MKSESKHRRSRSLRSFGALLGLFAYLWVSTPLPPALVAWLASLDGSHRVMVAQRGQSVEVVLCHDEKSPSMAAQHTHPRFSGALVLLAEPPMGPTCDHVLSFCSSSNLVRAGSRPEELLQPPRLAMPLHAAAASTVGAGHSSRVRASTLARSASLSESAGSYSVFVLRSTVFLI